MDSNPQTAQTPDLLDQLAGNSSQPDQSGGADPLEALASMGQQQQQQSNQPPTFEQEAAFKTQAWKNLSTAVKSGDLSGALHAVGSFFSSANPANSNAPAVISPSRQSIGQAAHETGQAGIGALKSAGQTAGTLVDASTGFQTNLRNADVLKPSNEDQAAGGMLEQGAEFALGDGIFKSLADLPIAERILKADKIMSVLKANPTLARIAGSALQNAVVGGTVGGIHGGEEGAIKGAELGAAGGAGSEVLGAAGEAVGNAASNVGKGISKVAGGVKALATDIPKDVESKLLSTIGEMADEEGFAAPKATTLKEAVPEIADQFKQRAQSVYQELDSEAPGFQELRDKTQQLQKAYKTQLNLDPAKADEIEGELKTAQERMDDLLNGGQKARWKAADADWSRYKALQQVAGKAAKASESLTDSSLTSVEKLSGGAQSLSNATRKGNPIDILSKAFGDYAGDIRSTIQNGMDMTSNAQAAKQFLKWAAYSTPFLGGAVYGGEKIASALAGNK